MVRYLMKRNYQVILEALLSVFIIIDILLLSLMIVGFTVGIKNYSIDGIQQFRSSYSSINIT